MVLTQARTCVDVAVHILADNSAVVFNEATQQLFSFDALATYLWCRWEAGNTRTDLAKALDTDTNLKTSSAQEMVDECLAQWRQHRLIGERSRVPPTPAIRQRAAPALPDTAGDSVSSDLQIAGEPYRLHYGSRAVAALVQPMLAHLERPCRGVPEAAFTLAAEADRFVLRHGAQMVEECDAADEVPPMVKFCLNVDLLEHGRYALAFHAAAVARGNGALLLPAASGSGKSTLTAGLLHDGWDYLTDDSALLDSTAVAVRGVGFDVCLKADAWTVVRPLFPALDGLPIYRRGDGHRVRYLKPPARLADPAAAYPVEWIVFPHYQADSACVLQEVAATDALQRLLREAFAPSRRLSRAGFRALAKLVEDKPCHSLTYGSQQDAVAVLRQLRR